MSTDDKPTTALTLRRPVSMAAYEPADFAQAMLMAATRRVEQGEWAVREGLQTTAEEQVAMAGGRVTGGDHPLAQTDAAQEIGRPRTRGANRGARDPQRHFHVFERGEFRQ